MESFWDHLIAFLKIAERDWWGSRKEKKKSLSKQKSWQARCWLASHLEMCARSTQRVCFSLRLMKFFNVTIFDWTQNVRREVEMWKVEIPSWCIANPPSMSQKQNAAKTACPYNTDRFIVVWKNLSIRKLWWIFKTKTSKTVSQLVALRNNQIYFFCHCYQTGHFAIILITLFILLKSRRIGWIMNTLVQSQA